MAEAQAALDTLKQQAAARYLPYHQFAVAYAGLGDDETVLECLELAIKDHDPQGAWLYAWPQFFHLHQHPRFLALYKLMRLTPP
jgi:hypothetical protein